MDMYERQESRASWENDYGDYIGYINAGHQGGAISPLMFTFYMDELFNQLQACGIGFHIGHEYYGSLTYADDLKLLCPGLRGLQKMVTICEQYGDRFSVRFNVKKLMCIIFFRVVDCSRKFNESIILNSNRLKWVNRVKDLGNYV